MHVLLVEDDANLRDAINDALSKLASGVEGQVGSARKSKVLVASSIEEGRALLQSCCRLMVVDLRLQGGGGLELVRHAMQLDTPPIVLAIDAEPTKHGPFDRLGVRCFLAKSVDVRELQKSLEPLLDGPINLERMAMAEVGSRYIHAVQDAVKKAMLVRALEVANGKVAGAARKLGVTRAAVQQMMDKYELRRGKSVPPPSSRSGKRRAQRSKSGTHAVAETTPAHKARKDTGN